MFWKVKLEEGRLCPIPAYIGKHVVEELQKLQEPADHWVSYKAAVRKQTGKPDLYDIRIVDEWELTKQGIKGMDYPSLDQHPELIKFEGWFNSKTHQVDIHARAPAVKEKTGAG